LGLNHSCHTKYQFALIKSNQLINLWMDWTIPRWRQCSDKWHDTHVVALKQPTVYIGTTRWTKTKLHLLTFNLNVQLHWINPSRTNISLFNHASEFIFHGTSLHTLKTQITRNNNTELAHTRYNRFIVTITFKHFGERDILMA